MTPALDARADRCRAPLQTGAAAGLVWLIASNVAGHHLPVSAPVVAVIAIGAAMTGRARRTMDVMIGVTIGIGLATLLVSIFGHGPLLLAFVVTAAMLAARAAHGGELLVTQAGIAATLVFAAHAGSTDAALARVADALIGAASAGLVSLLVLPPHPSSCSRRGSTRCSPSWPMSSSALRARSERATATRPWPRWTGHGQ